MIDVNVPTAGRIPIVSMLLKVMKMNSGNTIDSTAPGMTVNERVRKFVLFFLSLKNCLKFCFIFGFIKSSLIQNKGISDRAKNDMLTKIRYSFVRKTKNKAPMTGEIRLANFLTIKRKLTCFPVPFFTFTHSLNMNQCATQ